MHQMWQGTFNFTIFYYVKSSTDLVLASTNCINSLHTEFWLRELRSILHVVTSCFTYVVRGATHEGMAIHTSSTTVHNFDSSIWAFLTLSCYICMYFAQLTVK